MLVDAVWYRDGVGTRTSSLEEAVRESRRKGGFVWSGLHDPEAKEIEELVSVFGLHPLAVEDMTKGRQRPKVERYDDWLFVVLKTARYLDVPEKVDFGEIQILCDPHSIIVIRRGDPLPLAGLRRRLEADEDALGRGPVEVLHAVIDRVVDSYQRVMTGLDDDVSEVELDVFAERERGGEQLVERIYFLQREVLEVHRSLNPLIAALPTLRADRIVTAGDDWPAYFRDVHDHLLRQADQLQTIRELISAALTAHTAQVGLRQNDDMRRISAWVAIAAVPTMIAGIYGMNFENMPELGWTLGYPVALAIMLVVCLGMYRAFRRSGWL
ncbi:MAG: magnesium and cobalt transport protein CorA [Acidimicrobiales bacterium]